MTPSRSDLRQSVWLLFIPILWWGSSATSGWLSPSFESPSFEFIEFAIHSARTADYGMDPFTSAIAPIDPSIIDEAFTDQGNSLPDTLVPQTGDTTPDAGEEDDQEDSDSGANPPSPAPTTDPGNNGNGNGGENGNGGGNGNGNDGENGNGGGNGNGGDNGNGGGNGNNGKDNGKDETGLVPLLTELFSSL